MLTYNMKKDSHASLYTQLYSYIKEDIEKGKLKSHEKLPSKRALAEHLMLSIITVQNAYAQLVAEGYIYSNQRKGYFVSEVNLSQKELTYTKKNLISVRDNSLNGEAVYYSVDLTENAVNKEKFPFTLWAKLTRKVMQNNQDVLISKISPLGLWELRQAISEYLYRFRGVIADPNCIVIGAGADYLYGILIKLLGRESIYAVENPGYNKIVQVYNSENLNICYIPLDNNGLSVDVLSSTSANIVHLSPSHNFPTGIVMPIARRAEILEWASRAENRYIIEDDYDSEFRFASKPLPTLLSKDLNNKTIYINTFSKTIAPSLRISYMILPENLASKYNTTLSFLSCPVCGFDQHILASFIQEGHFERHISRMRKYYRQHRDLILQVITSSSIGDISQIREELSGLHFILKIKTNKSLDSIKKLCKEYGIKISFLEDYYHKVQHDTSNTPQGYIEFVINYAGVEVFAMKKAVEVLAKII